MIRRPPRSTLFPSPTLFRSVETNTVPRRALRVGSTQSNMSTPRATASIRSEEHTSELQSLRHLVCRLLLEKKMNEKGIIALVYESKSHPGHAPDANERTSAT